MTNYHQHPLNSHNVLTKWSTCFVNYFPSSSYLSIHNSVLLLEQQLLLILICFSLSNKKHCCRYRRWKLCSIASGIKAVKVHRKFACYAFLLLIFASYCKFLFKIVLLIGLWTATAAAITSMLEWYQKRMWKLKEEKKNYFTPLRIHELGFVHKM